MISDETRKRWRRNILDIEEATQRMCLDLNEWEESFIDSLTIQLSNCKDLSMKQSMKLNQIWEKIN